MAELINADSSRAKQARLGQAIGKTGFWLFVSIGVLAAVGSVVLCIRDLDLAWTLAGIALLAYLPAVWWKRQLSIVPPNGNDLDARLSRDILARLKQSPTDTLTLWKALASHWQTGFLLNHLLIGRELVEAQLQTDPGDLATALQIATKLADDNHLETIELGLVVAGILSASSAVRSAIVQRKSQPEDLLALANLLARTLLDENRGKPNYGGIGRDWTFGFTPILNHFGKNLTQEVMHGGAHYDWLAESANVQAIETAFESHAHAVVLVGPDGIGKTSNAYGLAQRLIEGAGKQALAYHQIVAINATQLVSAAQRPGALENSMLNLAGEAAHAGHIVLFFDDAQLFFNDAPGAVDASQILLTIIQSRAVPIILALTPSDYQRLKSKNSTLAGLLTPVILQEPSQDDVMRILEDASLGLEFRNGILITYAALHETYRLSGRYEQDEAYPGKAIKLLEQAVPHADHSLVTAESIQQTIEQTRGVKAGAAAPAEADQLLHLEDRIHERMINQKHAVEVVANALRRARAGVTNPKRPIGSFLFLGPTGVGKTELAKAIAATYFGAEQNMIRLDMSEYQQPDDVQRLLATGEHETSSLLMQVRQQPFAVVLLDEIEKAHPNILNLLLQLLDEGQLTDASGRSASFKDCIIIATSNAGANTIREKVAAGQSLESLDDEFTNELINSGQFKPELINRFDDLILFRPLNANELGQVVRLMLAEVNQTLTNQNITVALTDDAVAKIVEQGNDPRLGARPMRRALQKAVEDSIAKKILSGAAQPGDTVTLDAPDLTN